MRGCENIPKKEKELEPIDRHITIPSLNNGNEFEVPKRKVRHTKYVMEKTLNTPKQMLGTEQNIHLSYVILKDIFKDLKIEDIENLEEHELLQLAAICWDSTEVQKVIRKFRATADSEETTD